LTKPDPFGQILRWEDYGCRRAPSCLSCPHLVCTETAGGLTMRKIAVLLSAFFRKTPRGYMSVAMIAEALNSQVEHVARLLYQQKRRNPPGSRRQV